MPLPLVTERLLIRDFRPSDFAAVHAFQSDPEVARYTSRGPYTSEDTLALIGSAIEAAEADPRDTYQLVATRHDQPFGRALLLPNGHRIYEIGYSLAREAWGQGYGSEIARALTAFAFDHLEAHRLFGRVDPANLPSIKILERLGYRREGVLRKDLWKENQWWDTGYYGLLENEWEAREKP
ncbi:MAG: GNAT family N-acetyltransferase [Acidobacteriota bacterium]